MNDLSHAPAADNPTADDRRGYLGGSDAAVLIGFAKWSTPMQLFAQKTGRTVDVSVDATIAEHFYFGHLLEGPIGQAVMERFDLPVKRAQDFYRHPTHEWMGGHIDFLLADGSGFLECKNIRYPTDWGPMQKDWRTNDGSHLIPEYYLAQCLHYLCLLDLSHGFIAPLIGGNDLRIYRVTRDANVNLIHELIEAERAFWYDHVLKDEPPEPHSADDVLRWKMMLPTEDSARQLNTLATEPIIELFKELGNARVAEVKAQKRVDKARNKLVLAARGPAQFFDGSGEKVGTITLGSRSSLDAKRFQAEAPIAAEIASRFRKKTWYFTVRSNMVMGALEEVIDSNGG